MSDHKEETTLITYIGRRLKKGAIQHCFEEQDGDENHVIWYPKAKKSRFKGAIIGRQYKVGTHLPQFWDQAETGVKASEERCLQMQQHDRGTEMEQRQKGVEPSPELEKLVEQLRGHRSGLTAMKKAGFDAWLLNKIR